MQQNMQRFRHSILRLLSITTVGSGVGGNELCWQAKPYFGI